MNVKRVAIIGECMVELQKSGDLYKQSFGGDTLNTALYLSRMTKNRGLQTSYVTGLGKDPFSKQMLAQWIEEGIDTSLVSISENKLPGLYSIDTTADGERSFFYWRNDSAAKFWLREKNVTEVVTELCKNQVIYLSGISLAILPTDCLNKLIDILTQCKAAGVTLSFDNNFRPALWESKHTAQLAYTAILKLTDIAFLTFDDEVALYGDTTEQQCIQRTQALGVNEIVIKRGADDCLIITGDVTISVPAIKVSNIVDTTAAGDSFSAGYLAKRLTGGTTQQAAISGHTLAGTVIQHRGAIIPQHAMPTL
jgi:2-dehydro-3-deoxygluconokinase